MDKLVKETLKLLLILKELCIENIITVYLQFKRLNVVIIQLMLLMLTELHTLVGNNL